MKTNLESTKPKRVKSSIVLYAAGAVVGVIGIALLITNVLYFKTLLSQYVSQGYGAGDVAKQLVPSQLLPAVFNSIGVYGGISVLLFGAGIINEKVSKASEVTEAKEVNETEVDNEIEEEKLAEDIDME